MGEAKPLFPRVAVNGCAIPEAAIAAEAQNHPAPKGKPGLAWRAAARALVLRALLLDEAARRGLTPEPADLGRGRRETDDEALIRQLLEAEIAVEQPSEAEVRARWQAGPERFRSPDLIKASHVLFAAPVGDIAARAVARDRARAALAELAAEPAKFGALARSVSDCPSKKDGGALGQQRPGDLVPEFEAALLELAPGEVGPKPVETQFGLHIVRLDARATGRDLPYAAVRPKLAEAMEKAAWARAAREFALRLAEKAEIEGVAFAEAA